MAEMMVRCREAVESSAKIAMRALPRPRIAKTLLRDDEIARRKSFGRQKSIKLTDRNSLLRLIKMRASNTGRANARISLDGVSAMAAFYGVTQGEKEPARCPKSMRPPRCESVGTT
ncbi:MAG: hypothetical protein JO141_10460 [Bradyrhizobium sp.]|nr:hypothetical protein [Bradyrhizobium sp.]